MLALDPQGPCGACDDHSMNDATVFLIDDDASVRDALGLLLSLNGIRTQLFASAESFLETYRTEWRGCVVTDLRMPEMSGLDLQLALLDREISIPVVVLTGHGDVQTTRLAMKSGVFDFLEKPIGDELLLDVLNNAIHEDARRHDATHTAHTVHTRLERLTPREHDVLELLVDGLSQREIAARLKISPRTVEVYKARMMEKLQCRSLAEVVRVAIATGSTTSRSDS
jgi:two-component system, LuxR family, response regulator FixJ